MGERGKQFVTQKFDPDRLTREIVARWIQLGASGDR
jgi:hypothetical protein